MRSSSPTVASAQGLLVGREARIPPLLPSSTPGSIVPSGPGSAVFCARRVARRQCRRGVVCALACIGSFLVCRFSDEAINVPSVTSCGHFWPLVLSSQRLQLVGCLTSWRLIVLGSFSSLAGHFGVIIQGWFGVGVRKVMTLSTQPITPRRGASRLPGSFVVSRIPGPTNAITCRL